MRTPAAPLRLRPLALVVLALVAAPGVARADDGHVAGKPLLDVRTGERAPVPAPVAAGRRALDRRLGALGRVESAPGGGVEDVRRVDGFLSGPSPADAATIVLDYVRARPEVFGLDATDLEALRLEARSTSADGITTLRWVQTVDGIASVDTGIVAHVARDGRLISVGGGARPDLAVDDASPTLGPAAAYREAVADAGGALVAPRAAAPAGAERETTFADGGGARLGVLVGAEGGRLVWRTVAYDVEGHGYEQALDADTGRVLVRRPLTAHESRAEVYLRFPGGPQGGTPTPVDLAANPRWMTDTAGGTRLAGDFTHTYTDRSAPNGFNAGEDVPPSGGSDWLYPLVKPPVTAGDCPTAPAFCTWNADAPSTLALNESSSAVNLFFHVNRFHDHLLQAPIGFTPASGNFEGTDRVLAENNDYTGFDNANFSTPPDGTAPRMQMFARKSPYDLQGSHSAETVYHEYTHGLTNRLVVEPGGGSTLNGDQARSMGEGWSDWYALDFLERSGYAVDDPAAVGDLSYGAYWNGSGIRSQAIDCRVGDTTGRCATNGGAYTYQDIRGLVAPHTSGEMWSQTLWDVRRAIGSTEAERLVTGGLRLSPADPTYLDMRDAILQADLATGGTHYAQLWTVFAARGMGVSARSDATTVTAATEAFDLPVATVADDPVVRDLGGDRDGVADPGETVTLRPTLRNTTVAPLPAGAATIASATAGVSVESATANWPSLATLGTAATDDDVTVTVAPSVACGTPAALSATLAGGGGALPFTLRVGAPVVPSGTVWTTAAPNATIPSGTHTGRSSTITLPGPGTTIQDVDVRIDALTHPWLGDLELYLAHAGGPRIPLVRHAGRGGLQGGALTGTIFDDQAPTAFATASRSGSPYTGRWRPAAPLRRFEGDTTAGTWTLTAVDRWGSDVGTLGSWSIGFSTRSTGCEDNSAAAATTAATGVGVAAATIGGTVDAAGAATGYRIRWGATASYGSATPVASAGAARGPVARTTTLNGLARATTYHYRVEALRFDEVVAAGADRTFTTLAAPPPSDPADPVEQDETPLAPPVAPPFTPQSAPPGASPVAPAPAPTPTPAPQPAPTATPAAGTPRFAFASARTLRVVRGRVTVRLSAPPSARGTLTLRAGTRTIGTARFGAARSGTVSTVVELDARGRSALRRARGKRLSVTARATAGSRSATARLTLRG